MALVKEKITIKTNTKISKSKKRFVNFHETPFLY